MKSKLSLHVNFVTEPDAMRDFILQARPAVVKTLHHDRAFWEPIVAECPEVLFVGRMYRDDQSELIADKEKGAERFFRLLQGQATWDDIMVWEGLNEVGPHPTSDYMCFELRLCDLLHSVGKKYVAGSWSVGCPALGDWDSEWLLEVVRRTDYLGLHEYCAPCMNDPRGFDPPGTGWFTLRYRQVYDILEQHDDMDIPPLLITECGIDSGAAHWDPGAQGGWRSFTDVRGYLSQLVWYDQHLQADPYVVGATIFCWGTLDPTWDTFDLKGEMSNTLEKYICSTSPPPGGSIEGWLGSEMQQYIIPLNPAAYFHKYARERELGMARTPEIGYDGELVWEGKRVLAQVFVDEINDPQWQHIVWAYLDDDRPWDQKTSHFDRPN